MKNNLNVVSDHSERCVIRNMSVTRLYYLPTWVLNKSRVVVRVKNRPYPRLTIIRAPGSKSFHKDTIDLLLSLRLEKQSEPAVGPVRVSCGPKS